MTPRNVQLPSISDIGGYPTEQVVLEILLIDGSMTSLAAFRRTGTTMVGARPKRYVLTDATQTIPLIPTDDIFPQSWYLIKLQRHDSVQAFRCQVPSFQTGDEDPLTWETLVMIQEGIDSGQIGKNRLLPANPQDQDIAIYDAASDEWIPVASAPGGSGGDMQAAFYDPQGKAVDAFLLDNLEGIYDCGEV